MPDLPFPYNIPPIVSFIFLASWLFMFLTSREQMRRIKKRTEALVLSIAKKAMQERPGLTLNQLYELVLPDWRAMVPKTAWYILHKTELFPVPARPDTVIERLKFGPDYVGTILIDHQVELAGRDFNQLKARVSQERAKPKRRR
jgi:hypothetical protein